MITAPTAARTQFSIQRTYAASIVVMRAFYDEERGGSDNITIIVARAPIRKRAQE